MMDRIDLFHLPFYKKAEPCINRAPQEAFSFGKNPTSACGNRLTLGQSSTSVRHADPITCFNAATDKPVAVYGNFHSLGLVYTL